MVRLTVTVTFSFTSGRLAVINACIIITVVVGILSIWFFTNGIYKNIYLSTQHRTSEDYHCTETLNVQHTATNT